MAETASSLPLMLRLPLALGAPLLRSGAPLAQPLLLGLLQRALRDSGLEGELDMLRERCLAIEVTDLGVGWRLTAGPGGLAAAPARLPADATISGEAAAFLLLMSRREDPDTLFFRRRLAISGDTALGLAVKNLLDALEPEALPWPLRRLLEDLGWVAQRLEAGRP